MVRERENLPTVRGGLARTRRMMEGEASQIMVGITICWFLAGWLSVMVPAQIGAQEETVPGAFADRTTEASACVKELQLALGALEADDGEAAIQHYQRALDLATNPELEFQALLGLGSAQAALGQLVEAESSLERARDLAPDNPAIWYTLGSVYASSGRVDAALRALEESCRLDPDDARAQYDRCLLLAGIEEYGQASRACDMAVEADPEMEEAWIGAGVAHFHSGAYDDAERSFAGAVELSPDNARAVYGLGLSRLYKGDADGAVAQYVILKTLDRDLANDLYARVVD